MERVVSNVGSPAAWTCPRIGWRVTAALVLGAVLAAGSGAEPATQSLFRIERSKNANVVQYDAVLGGDGRLNAERPVVAYWLRLARDGSRRDLNWIERRMAYGFKARYEAKEDVATLDLAADVRRRIRVYAVDGTYRAETRIDGARAFLSRLFIQSDESGRIPEVVHIDFFGEDAESGEPRYERFEPR